MGARMALTARHVWRGTAETGRTREKESWNCRGRDARALGRLFASRILGSPVPVTKAEHGA